MAAMYANKAATMSGINRGFCYALLLLIMAIFSACAQEYLDLSDLTPNMLNNKITQSPNSARRLARYDSPRNSLRTKENCKNSVVGACKYSFKICFYS